MNTQTYRWRRHRVIACLAASTMQLLLTTHAVADDAMAMQGAPMKSMDDHPAQAADERRFLKENDVAMKTMMQGMEIHPGGVDKDFVTMMTAHHQGAIDMAKALLAHSHNEALRRLAQEIIVTQQEEITAMRLAVSTSGATSSVSPSAHP